MGNKKNKNQEKNLNFGCLIFAAALVFAVLPAIIIDNPIPLVIFLAVAISIFPLLVQRDEETKLTPAIDNALIGLISVIMKADGQATKSELEKVKPFLLKKFGEKQAKKMLLLLKEKLQKDIRNVRPHCLSINRSFTYSQKLEFYTLLFRIAEANGEICENEADLLSRIAKHISIRNSDFIELTHEFSTFYNYQKRQTTVVYRDTSWAYKALLIEENASMEEVKKAYRKLAMQYHPDKVSPHDTFAQKEAADKFYRINEAYKHLQKEKR